MTDERHRPPPAERFDATHLTFDLHREIATLRAEPGPARHGHRQKTLHKAAGRTIALFVFDRDAELSDHSAAGVVTIQPLEGTLTVDVIVDGVRTPHTIGVGDLFTMIPHLSHAVRADTDAAFLLQVSLDGSLEGPLGSGE